MKLGWHDAKVWLAARGHGRQPWAIVGADPPPEADEAAQKQNQGLVGKRPPQAGVLLYKKAAMTQRSVPSPPTPTHVTGRSTRCLRVLRQSEDDCEGSPRLAQTRGLRCLDRGE